MKEGKYIGGGHSGIFGEGMYRQGLENLSLVLKRIGPKIDTPF